MKLSFVLLVASLAAGLAPAAVTSDALDSQFQRLKDAESRKDAAQVRMLAIDLFAAVRDVTSAPAPADEAEKAAWQNRVAYARDIQVYAEYALSAVAVQSPAAVTVDLLSTLELQSPKSKYLDMSYASYFVALNHTGQASRIPAIAEKAIANFPENDDLLLIVADTARNRKQSAAALTYARRLVAVLGKKAKPEGVSAADWERKRNAALGRGYWIAGMELSEKNQYYEADRNLRSALPLVKGTDAMTAPALYYLGVANFQLGKMTMNKAQILEGVRFSEQAAAFTGPFQQPAWHNATVMKAEAARMR